MIQPIVLYGDAVLREKCATVTDVTDEIRALAQDMIETMHASDGVGLAAPQVGVPIQLAVIDVAHAAELQSYFRVDGKDLPVGDFMPLVFINPRLDLGKKKATDIEGCLSFPKLRYQITRPGNVKAHLTLLDGRQIVIETDGLLSRALQHETDHLHGRLFIDRLSPVDKLGLKKRLQEMRAEIEEDAG
ncbi:MAG: peptide deformylase [Verrucomicrobiales bacterium]